MIYFDDFGFPCDQTGDVGDSAVRAGLLKLCASGEKWQYSLLDYEIRDGKLCRHPHMLPWCNYRNMSRDNTMPIIAGFNKLKLHDAPKRVFFTLLKRGFIGTNIERDWPGTRKKPWPHIMRGGDPKDNGKWRLFDFPDLFWSPGVIGALILAGRVKAFYPILPICYAWHLLSIIWTRFSKKEINQMIAECSIYGTLKALRLVNPGWESVSAKYWQSRNEHKMHELLKQLIESA
jgi:hypothetical protein